MQWDQRNRALNIDKSKETRVIWISEGCPEEATLKLSLKEWEFVRHGTPLEAKRSCQQMARKLFNEHSIYTGHAEKWDSRGLSG